MMTVQFFLETKGDNSGIAGRVSGTRLTQPELQALKDHAKALFVIDVVSHATGIAPADIMSASRNNARAARARQMAMYLAYITYQWPLARIGTAFRRDRTTAGHACRLIEDLRDDRVIDRELDKMEACLKNAPEPLAIMC